MDYLTYTLLDTIIDNYIFIIERMGEQIEDLENEILKRTNKDVLSKINNFKREMNFILQLSRLDSNLIQSETQPFIKALLDLANQTVNTIDSYRDMLSDHLSIYNTEVGNRLNEIMKILTMLSAIFFPITFIAGIYGTNFDNTP